MVKVKGKPFIDRMKRARLELEEMSGEEVLDLIREAVSDYFKSDEWINGGEESE